MPVQRNALFLLCVMIMAFSPAYANTAPVVNAGNDQTIVLPAVATLAGTASDDGLPNPPARLTCTWSQVGGPGTVTFGDPAALATTAAFSTYGTYVLQLEASDGQLHSVDWVTVTVNPALDGTITIVRTGATYSSIQAAHDAAIAGDIIEISSGTYVGDTVRTEISKPNLTIRGVGPTRPILDSYYEVKNSKGLFVTTAGGSNLTIENLELRNAYSWWAANAACIRMQSAGLTVRNCYFHHGGNGILSQGFPDSHVLVEHCEFSDFGTGNGQEHNLYIGKEDSFTMRYCYSHNCNAGHLVKTRARKNYILYNRLGNFGDQSSYEVNIPSAGESYVIGNLIYQANSYQNSTIIDYLSEYPRTGSPNLPEPNADQHLYVINNTVVNDRPGAVFVRNGAGTLDNIDDDTDPNYFPVALVQNNIFAGSGTAVTTAGSGTTIQLNNWSTTVANARLAWTSLFDYRLTASSVGAIDLGGSPGVSHTGYPLTPTQQYVHPLSYQDRPINGPIDIGAYEYVSQVNQAPYVDAGADQVTIAPRYTINLAGTANDDGLPSPSALTYAWSAISGPGTVTFGNASSLTTTATLSEVGTYVLQLQVSDGLLSSADTLTVTVNPDLRLGGTLTFQNGLTPDATYAGCQDTWIHSNAPTSNYSNNDWGNGMGQYSGTKRSLIRFDVGAIPATMVVKSARLRLAVSTAGSTFTLEAYPVLQPWTPTGCTWNSYAAGQAWDVAGCDGIGTDRAASPAARIEVARTGLARTWIDLPLSVSLVQGWVNGSISNNGVLLKVTNESSGEMRFYPETHPDPLLRPKLVVELQPANMGDIDGDGTVDVVDLLYLVEAFGSVTGDPNYNAACDFNSDGSIDVIDLLTFVQDYWPKE